MTLQTIDSRFIAQFAIQQYHQPVDSSQLKKLCTRIKSILYQTNLSNVVLANGLYYFSSIQRNHDKLRSYYKHSQDNLLIEVIVCLMLANKTYEDSSFTSKTWSNVSKFPLKKLNCLEIQILQELKFDIFKLSFNLPEYDQWNWYLAKQMELQRKVQTPLTPLNSVRRNTRYNSKKIGSRALPQQIQSMIQYKLQLQDYIYQPANPVVSSVSIPLYTPPLDCYQACYETQPSIPANPINYTNINTAYPTPEFHYTSNNIALYY